MKKISGIMLLLMIGQSAYAQQADSTGLPGDHFSLEGAIEMFKNSKDLEDFEKAINKENNHVNNLDLNQDGEIDYLRVENQKDGDAHAIIIRAIVNKDEQQDIAVIGVEKTGEEEAILQIVGDEEIYGEGVIAEPFEEEMQEGKGGPAMYHRAIRIVVNVWLWRPVRWLFGPRFVIWSSPYYWGYYPTWWRPWRPYPWYRHYGYCTHYHVHVHHVHVHRVTHAHRVYTPHRRTSVHVHNHYRKAHDTHRASGRQVTPQPAKATQTKGVDRNAAPKSNQPTQGRSTTKPQKNEAPAAGKAVNHNTVRSTRQKSAKPTPSAKPATKPARNTKPAVNRAPKTKAPKAGGGGKR